MRRRVQSATTASGRPLRVRIGKGYHIPFITNLGQSNVQFIEGPMLPVPWKLRRFVYHLQSIAAVEPGCDILHSYNAVPFFPWVPYIISFEDYLPRTPPDHPAPLIERFLQRELAKPRCTAILAMSEYALRRFHTQCDRFEDPKILRAKAEVLYPSMPERDVHPKSLRPDKLRLLIVGKDFIHKGVPAAMRAHALLRKAGVPVETTVVSSLRWWPSYAVPPDHRIADDEQTRLRQDGVRHFPGLPNSEVLRLMSETDFLLFPTVHDTFGFVALEALSNATPVIATGTCALPEIVRHGRCGFLLSIDNDPDTGAWRWLYKTRKPGFVEAFMEQTERFGVTIAETLQSVWESRCEYEPLSAGAIEHSRTRFSRSYARARLERLYAQAAQSN